MIGRSTRRLLPLLALTAGAAFGQSDPQVALNEGNRLFRNGQVEEAVAAYRAGWSPDAPHPTLVYNLGSALHHLDRLPEAILWYRRAGDSEDPWLEENLWLARRSLGSQVLEPGGLMGGLAAAAPILRWVAVGLAWIALGVVVGWRRLPSWGAATAFALTACLYLGAVAVERWGPRPAVLLADCRSPAGELPAGTEAWVRPTTDGGYRIAGSAAVCPAETLELVFPEP
jgi:hypothetical protein